MYILFYLHTHGKIVSAEREVNPFSDAANKQRFGRALDTWVADDDDNDNEMHKIKAHSTESTDEINMKNRIYTGSDDRIGNAPDTQ